MVFIVGQVDLKVGQVNFAELLARGQVFQKSICQPLEHTYMYVLAYGYVLMSITQHTIIRLLLSICLIPLQLIIVPSIYSL